ncbi:MAG: MBL fold metallo-hydrolase [Clostridia bacterium]|nr:MBL fold metallo-hydrolase [Clostridia bacterium]
MRVHKIYPKGFGANTYVLTADDQRAVVIDPSGKHVESKLLSLGLQAEYVLLTHCHFDHVIGVAGLQESGAKVGCLDKEKALIGTTADLFDAFGAPRTPYRVDFTFSDGEDFELCGIKIKALSTPGHTVGSACYLVESDGGRYLFSGDTLFEMSIGRTDFPTGDTDAIRKSLQKIANLPDMPVYAGHGEDTTIEREKKYNPFLQD